MIDHEGLDLSVRSIENKGNGVVVAKVGVSLETNKTAIHREMSGQVSNTIQQLHDIKAGEGEELAKILAMLQAAIESDRALTPDQKQQALEAVSTLAEEGSKPPQQRTAKFCTMAVNALKGLASRLTDANKLAEAAKMLLPTLTGIFGLCWALIVCC